MFYVLIYSNKRDVPATFAKRHRMCLSPAFNYNQAQRGFRSLTSAQDFAYKLLGKLKRDYFLYLVCDGHDGCIIYQEGL